MTNEVIAAQVADSMVGAANSMYPTIYDAIIEALRMKDKQLLTLYHECEERTRQRAKELGLKYFPDELSVSTINVDAYKAEYACLEMARWKDEQYGVVF